MEVKYKKAKARAAWLKVYEELGCVSKAVKRCGIARSTLYRWLARYENKSQEELLDRSQKPKKLANQKIDSSLKAMILSIRQNYGFGPQRIATHLLREYKVEVSSPTIWRVLKQSAVPPLKRYRSPSKPKRYSRPIPGDRVQLDVTKIRANCYQFTAVDDCTRLRVLRLYPNKTAENAISFLFEMLESFPFPIQRIQTDWRTEFFNDSFQEELMVHFI